MNAFVVAGVEEDEVDLLLHNPIFEERTEEAGKEDISLDDDTSEIVTAVVDDRTHQLSDAVAETVLFDREVVGTMVGTEILVIDLVDGHDLTDLSDVLGSVDVLREGLHGDGSDGQGVHAVLFFLLYFIFASPPPPGDVDVHENTTTEVIGTRGNHGNVMLLFVSVDQAVTITHTL